MPSVRAWFAEAKQEHLPIQLRNDAAQRWADYGFVLEHGHAFLGVPPVSTVSGSAQPGEGWQMTADGPRPPPVPVARNPRPGPPIHA